MTYGLEIFLKSRNHQKKSDVVIMGLEKATWRMQETREEPQIKHDRPREPGGRVGIEQDLEGAIPEMEELEKTVFQRPSA